MEISVMVFGGYGGVGKSMSQILLRYIDCDLTISGRNLEKAEALVAVLKEKYPQKKIHACHADATDENSLIAAFQNIDLVIVTATIPDLIEKVAKIAIETETDMVDILVRGDVVDKLNKHKEAIVENKRRFITQSGIHPGLAAPIIRFAKTQFDDYQDANVALVMDAIFEKPESVYEIIYELVEGNSRILQDGRWRKATYRDILTVNFSEKFGTKKCFPLQLRELYGLEKELGLRNCGVYAAGFSPFIDNFVFPLAMFIGLISNKLSQQVGGWLMYMSIKKHLKNSPRVEFKLEAKGIKDHQEKKIELSVFSRNAYDFTALVILACLKQYFDNSISEPGLYLMGNIVDERRMFADLKEMGIQIQEIVL